MALQPALQRQAWRVVLAAAILALAVPSGAADEQAARGVAQQRGRFAQNLPDTVQNPGFEQSDPFIKLVAWFGVTHGGDSFRVEQDATYAHAGEKSLIIENTGVTSWGGAVQTISAGQVAGRDMELSAWVKTKGVTAPGFHIALKSAALGTELAYETSATHLTGDNDWTLVKLRVRVPKEATTVDLVLMQDGDGKSWVDEVRLEPASQARAHAPRVSGANQN